MMANVSTIDRVSDEKADTSDLISGLIKQVGDRVRNARERKGISRRLLSEQSGVSPRYLAQLEAGEGNISIGLLKRIADALGQPIEWFVSDDDPRISDALRVADMFRAADKDTQARVLRALGAEPSVGSRAGRLCLVGLRGAGKSTLGELAGKSLGVPFIELNAEIEAQAGMPIEEIMALYGQEGYRRLEADALDRVVETQDNVVLAVAGGIVAEPSTYAALLSRFHTIWIKASPEEHMDRVRAQGDERPMAGNPEAMAQLRSILTSREVLYDKAAAKLDTSGVTVQDSLAELLDIIEEQQFLS